MDPSLRAFLLSWNLRPAVLVPLALAALLYLAGWRRLRRRGSRRLATNWRPVAFLGGNVVVALALTSAIDSFSDQLFFMHMIQHLLLIMIAAPAIMLANPFPFIIWGLPDGRRLGLALFGPRAGFRRLLSAITGPGVVWMVLVAAIWGWHDPGAYQAALRSDLVHDLEHLTFYGAALLFWWHVVQSGPRLHRALSPGARIAYTLSGVPVNMIPGVAIAFSGQPIYQHYTTVPRIWGLSVMQDQMLGGILMWIPGSMMYILGGIILIARLMRTDESPTGPETEGRPAG